MNQNRNKSRATGKLRRLLRSTWLLCGVLLPCTAEQSWGQAGLVLNMGTIDGVDLTPDNVFNYTIQSNISKPADAVIRGKLTYRSTGYSFSYSYHYTLRPGVNVITKDQVHPQWTFSSSAFRELFMEYKKLPAGTYEYCVEAVQAGPGGEAPAGGSDADCLYGKVDDLFLINLVSPENNAKLHENYPVLTWMVNYPFASALTYKVRVAEVKDGQNNTAAVNRNNPVYEESNVVQTTVAYPVYAKELEKFIPYAWTVDAYYKGVLLGGAEAWRFTIIDDSVMMGIPRQTYFVDIRNERDMATYYAVGLIKLKYVLDEQTSDTLSVRLLDKNNKEIKFDTKPLQAKLGDNRFELNLKDQASLKHLSLYTLVLTNSLHQEYHLPFKYINPDFL